MPRFGLAAAGRTMPVAGKGERAGGTDAPGRLTGSAHRVWVEPMESAAPPRAPEVHARLLPALAADAETRLGRAEAVAFLARLEASLLDIFEPLHRVYGEDDL